MIKGIIFDMDNTLLRSRIDFTEMKKDIYEFMVRHGVLTNDLDLTRHTSSTIIEQAMQTNLMTAKFMQDVWEIAKRHELAGMHGADLEPGVTDLLQNLQGKYLLVVVTNNAVEAAETAIRDNGIYEYFDYIVGREMVKSLKPSPDGLNHVLEKYGHIAADEWLSVGDAWVDGKAAADAGIKFIAYRGDSEKMQTMGVRPFAEITRIGDLVQFLSDNSGS